MYKKVTWGEDTIVSKHGNKAGTSAGTILSSKSAERSAKHLMAPCTKIFLKNKVKQHEENTANTVTIKKQKKVCHNRYQSCFCLI